MITPSSELRWDWSVRKDVPGPGTGLFKVLEIDTPRITVEIAPGAQFEIDPFRFMLFAVCDQNGNLPEHIELEMQEKAHITMAKKAIEHLTVMMMLHPA